MARREYEKATIRKMIRLYCHLVHGNVNKKSLCRDCEELFEYACERLDKCPFGDGKGACKKCIRHCYRNDMREKIRNVMRFSGPRMLLYYPKDFVRHVFDGLLK